MLNNDYKVLHIILLINWIIYTQKLTTENTLFKRKFKTMHKTSIVTKVKKTGRIRTKLNAMSQP